jgi:hypothetical protein
MRMAKQIRTLMQLNFLNDTVEEVRLLARILDTENLTDVVGRCVHLSGMVVRAINNGDTVQILRTNGNREYLVIPGLSS